MIKENTILNIIGFFLRPFALILQPQVAQRQKQTFPTLRRGSSFLLSSVCTDNTGGGTLTGAPALVSSQLAVFLVLFSHFFACCFICREMWFIYLLSWLSLVIQISFVTLAIGKCMLRIPASANALPTICLIMLADQVSRRSCSISRRRGSVSQSGDRVSTDQCVVNTMQIQAVILPQD